MKHLEGIDPFEGKRYVIPKECRISIPPEPKKYKGMTWLPGEQTWIVRIRVQGRQFYLGKFKDQRDAALAYDNALWFLQDYMHTLVPELNLPDFFSAEASPKVMAIRRQLKQQGFPSRPRDFELPE
jgi:hypothetical protein